MLSLHTMLSIILLFVICRTANASYVTPCPAGDQVCIDNSANDVYQQFMAGIPDLGIEPSEPMRHEIIDANLSTLKYTFYNATIAGMNKCKIKNVQFSKESLSVQLQLLCPKIVLESDYESNGTLFLVPVHGNGDCRIVTGRYNFDFKCSAKIVDGSDSKQHVSIKSCKVTIDSIDPIEFDIRNLFQGNKQLSDMFHDFIHGNWKEVHDFVKDPVWNEHTKKLIILSNKYLKRVPLEDMKSTK